ncbi:hypothetical protein BC835DRAFT_1302663 [Cytidiella melzeri]|nr:hypothetical protein BC835DRAFT_1302663 [Cytidiella melzeri]
MPAINKGNKRQRVESSVQKYYCKACAMYMNGDERTIKQRHEKSRRHLKNTEQPLLSFSCGDCTRKYTREDSLQRHRKSAHTQAVAEHPEPEPTLAASEQSNNASDSQTVDVSSSPSETSSSASPPSEAFDSTLSTAPSALDNFDYKTIDPEILASFPMFHSTFSGSSKGPDC